MTTKISELLKLLESSKYTHAELYKMAHTVGKREFGLSTQGFVFAPFKNVVERSVRDFDSIGTYEWVFYPSNLETFEDYSDSDISKVDPDIDGLIYSADENGNVFITTGAKFNKRVKNPIVDEAKKLKGQKIMSDWYVAHVAEYRGDSEYTPAGQVAINLENKLDAKLKADCFVNLDQTYSLRVLRWDSHVTPTDLLNHDGKDFTFKKLKEHLSVVTV